MTQPELWRHYLKEAFDRGWPLTRTTRISGKGWGRSFEYDKWTLVCGDKTIWWTGRAECPDWDTIGQLGNALAARPAACL